MKTLLCFGDSNTWGSATVPRPDGRYRLEERWTGFVRRRLGADWHVVEEGLPGRTTIHKDPVEGAWMDGSAYLMPCLRSHRPIDAVVVMLGTNDLKMRFNVPAGDIAGGIGVLLTIIRHAEAGPNAGTPKILVVCPAPILDRFGECPQFAEMFTGGHEKSLRLAPLVREVAAQHGAAFLDAGTLIRSSAYDGIHLDAEAHAILGPAIGDAVAAMAG
jgi:lysophospholipase L1-like esterase